MVMVRVLSAVVPPSCLVLLSMVPGAVVRTWPLAILLTLIVNSPTLALVEVVAANAVLVLVTVVEFQVSVLASLAAAVCRVVSELCNLP
ncbi:hypothetical protein D3C78_955420 [compost metagenome]